MKSNILKELKEHIPFTIAATLVSVAIMSFLLIRENLIQYAISSFEIFHPAHILFSSLVSAAIFYNYKKKIFLSAISGVLIAVVIGSVSDVIFPYLGGLLFNIPISFHLPALESPALIFGVAILGSTAGIIIRKTKFPHFIHVLLSVFASLLYIFSYSTNFSLITLFFIFVITSISVVVPCCLGDIVFPLLLHNKLRKREKI
ncbi:MAG: hypothetical protein PHH00_02955 [Candidatus Nanoarchaeia archaeon]|nr:hypothetical protein [Candidatus Nanoarchaeia archaeon]